MRGRRSPAMAVCGPVSPVAGPGSCPGGGERAPMSMARPPGARGGLQAVNRLARHPSPRGTGGMPPGDQTHVTVCISQPFRRA